MCLMSVCLDLCVNLSASGLGSGLWGNILNPFIYKRNSSYINSNGIILFFNVFIHKLSASVSLTCKLDHILWMVCFRTELQMFVSVVKFNEDTR